MAEYPPAWRTLLVERSVLGVRLYCRTLPEHSMADNDIPKLYLQLHEAELKNRDAVGTALAPFTSTLTLLGGGAFYLVTHVPDGVMGRLAGVLFVGFLSAGVLALLAAAAYALAALWSRYYSHVPSLGAIERWRVENEPYHVANPSARPTFEERFWSGVASELAAAADENRATNRAKGDQAFRSKVLTTASLLLFGCALAAFLWIGAAKTDTEAKTIIINGASMTDNNHSGSEGGESQTKAQDPPKQTPFPSREKLREGNETSTGKPLNEVKNRSP